MPQFIEIPRYSNKFFVIKFFDIAGPECIETLTNNKKLRRKVAMEKVTSEVWW